MVALRAAFALPLLALAAFAYALGGPFHLDDFALFSDPLITSANGWWRVWRLEQTRPLTWLTFWANYQLADMHAVSWHAVNIALHAVAAWLTLDVLSRLLPQRAAFIAAVIYAIHPLQTEAVAYVFARSSVLATVFSLLSMRSWVRGRHWAAVAWFVPALLAKEECVSLPLFFALLHFSISRNRREYGPIGAMLGLSILAGLRVLFALSITPGAPAGPNIGITPLEYLGAQGYAVWRYLQLLLVPVGFSVDPDVPLRPQWWAWVFLIVLVGLAVRRFRAAGPGFWFLAGLVLLLPSSSVFPAIDLAADRRMYLPMVAFSACVALLILHWRPAVLIVIGGVLAAITLQRIYVWNAGERLWSEAVELAPAKLRPRIQLARSAPLERAVHILLDAKKIAASDPKLASELGRVYLQQNRPIEALQEFGVALAAEPRNSQYLVNRGVALAYLDQKDAAVSDFRRALEIDPCSREARLNLVQLGIKVLPVECP